MSRRKPTGKTADTRPECSHCGQVFTDPEQYDSRVTPLLGHTVYHCRDMEACLERRKALPEGETVEATAEPQQTVPVRLQIVFGHDEKPLGALTYDTDMPLPTQPGQMGQVVVVLDAREIMMKLAQALQPQQQQPKPGGILVPGAPRVPRELFRPGPSAVKLKADD